MRTLAPWAALGLALSPAPAVASDDAFEFWLNPSASIGLDDDTSLEIETAQRFRSAADGRPDTYFVRFWLHQDVSDAVTVSGAIGPRANDGDGDELRLHQQISTRHGLLRTRLRLEQRFVEDGRMGLRLRPRLGVAVPFAAESPWAGFANVEAFLTLRSTSRGGDDGLTGVRTQIGVEYEASDRVSLSLGYLRQQSIDRSGPDEVGHAPIVGVEFSF